MKEHKFVYEYDWLNVLHRYQHWSLSGHFCDVYVAEIGSCNRCFRYRLWFTRLHWALGRTRWGFGKVGVRTLNSFFAQVLFLARSSIFLLLLIHWYLLNINVSPLSNVLKPVFFSLCLMDKYCGFFHSIFVLGNNLKVVFKLKVVFLCRYALRWESKHIVAVSTAVQDWLTSSEYLTSCHFYSF